MRTVAGALCALLLAGCQSLPAERPMGPGAVLVTILDRDADTGKVSLALENKSREQLAYLWYHVAVSAAPSAGQRQDPYDLPALAGRPAPLRHDIPLGPGRRQVISFECSSQGDCRSEDVYLGVLVCRQQPDYCRDYEVVWSRVTIAQAISTGAR